MSEKILQLSEPGVDPSSASVRELILDSDYTHPKIVLGNNPSHFEFDSYTFGSEPSANSDTTLFTIPHGYDYIPMAIVQMVADEFGDTIFNLPFIQQGSLFTPPSTFGFFEEKFYYYADSTNVYIKFKRTVVDGTRPPGVDKNGTTWSFKWLIFAESGLS